MTTIEKLKGHKLVYLATPYSKYPGGTVPAWVEASKYAGRLLKAGVVVFSPIAHSHPLAVFGDIETRDHDFWLGFDEHFMRLADAVCVMQMDGWEESIGVQYEIAHFAAAGKPVYFLKPESL